MSIFAVLTESFISTAVAMLMKCTPGVRWTAWFKDAHLDEYACHCICWSEFWSGFVMHMSMCRGAFTFTQQQANKTELFYWMLLTQRAANNRLTDISQPCENTVNTHGPLVWILRVSPAGWLCLHACLDWVAAVKGVAALQWDERHRLKWGISAGTVLPSDLHKPCQRASMSCVKALTLPV